MFTVAYHLTLSLSRARCMHPNCVQCGGLEAFTAVLQGIRVLWRMTERRWVTDFRRLGLKIEDLHASVEHYCILCTISGFCRTVDEICTLSGWCAASSDVLGTTCRSHLQESRIMVSWPLKMGPIGCTETSLRNYHYSLRNNPEDCSSHNSIMFRIISYTFRLVT